MTTQSPSDGTGPGEKQIAVLAGSPVRFLSKTPPLTKRGSCARVVLRHIQHPERGNAITRGWMAQSGHTDQGSDTFPRPPGLDKDLPQRGNLQAQQRGTITSALSLATIRLWTPLDEKWPSLRGAALARIIEKHCGAPQRRSGSHRRYKGKHRDFTFAFHDRAEVTGKIVRRVLIEDVGLSPDEARNEVS
jgi:predicted RNA binding protein YcfA (HicA-like mRNA interferase family)